VKGFDPEHDHSLAGRKKNPSTKLGLEAFTAVTHQGPAQGGKAGGGKPPIRNLSKQNCKFKLTKKYLTCADSSK
jgi:hypothetical protein